MSKNATEAEKEQLKELIREICAMPPNDIDDVDQEIVRVIRRMILTGEIPEPSS